MLGDVISADDELAEAHSHGVVSLALAISDELGIDEDEQRLVEFAAMLHDIGKIETPREILHKPGPLTEEEWEAMRVHTIAGQRMLDRVGGTLHDVGLVVRSARERFDGGGYPDGLGRRADPAGRARRRRCRRVQRDDGAPAVSPGALARRTRSTSCARTPARSSTPRSSPPPAPCSTAGLPEPSPARPPTCPERPISISMQLRQNGA